MAKFKGLVSATALTGILSIFNLSSFVFAQDMNASAAVANFNLTTGIATDSTGAVYIANSHDTILKITRAGVVMTLAGKPDERGTTDGVGSAARFIYPIAIATDSAANVYVADKVSNTIRKITPAGFVTTLAGSAGVRGHEDGAGSNALFSSPTGVATDSEGNIYVADSDNNTIRKISPTGVVTTLAGLAGESGNSDGTGATARFATPYGIATDHSGNIFVVEMFSHTLRKITPDGVVTTFAGKIGEQGHADGTGKDATFHTPRGVATDKAGNIFVADVADNIIRKVTPTGMVTTLAGRAGLGEESELDGTGGAARFLKPVSVATDSAGNVFVLESNNIRQVTSKGVVTTFAGPVFGPWHLQAQYCEWDVPPDNRSARSGSRRCSLNVGTTYCSSAIEVTSANPKNTRPKLSLVYDESNGVIGVDTKFKLDHVEYEKPTAKDDPPANGMNPGSWLHYVVTITVSSTNSCKQ